MALASGYQQLAADLVTGAVASLKAKRPKRGPNERTADYQWRVAEWERRRNDDRAWFRNPKRSAMWIEASGLTWEAVTSGLTARGWLPDEQAA